MVNRFSNTPLVLLSELSFRLSSAEWKPAQWLGQVQMLMTSSNPRISKAQIYDVQCNQLWFEHITKNIITWNMVGKMAALTSL